MMSSLKNGPDWLTDWLTKWTNEGPPLGALWSRSFRGPQIWNLTLHRRGVQPTVSQFHPRRKMTLDSSPERPSSVASVTLKFFVLQFSVSQYCNKFSKEKNAKHANVYYCLTWLNLIIINRLSYNITSPQAHKSTVKYRRNVFTEQNMAGNDDFLRWDRRCILITVHRPARTTNGGPFLL